jgi:class 3 adenylate cyclase/tetratricopeptide (TPR) repeat protein
MKCAECGAENREGAKFCNECAAPIEASCPRCGARNKPSAKFCDECGTSLGTSAAASPKKPNDSSIRVIHSAVAENLDGERKTVTALFADIKGSTELMEDLDPEQARAIIDPALQLMIEAVRRYDGYVVQSTGDGIFAMFGAPVAHEDHPQRALHAALAIQQELHDYRHRLKDHSKPHLEARIGVNTGEVVLRTVNTGGHTEYSPVGHVANLAARMQTVASASSIAITEETRQLIKGYFVLRELGPIAIKGIREPVNAYEVIGPGQLRGHFELAVHRGLTKFVGRERELAELRRILELAMGGHGQIVAVVADAGTGKSRLFHEFRATIPSECKLLEAYSVSYGKASAWLPVLELLRGYFGILDADDPSSRSAKVRAALDGLDPTLNELRPFLLALLGIQQRPDPLVHMEGRAKKQGMLEAVIRIILRESVTQPLVLIFEDLHWIDGETQELLNDLVDELANARILLLTNYRPEYHHDWNNRAHYTQVRLGQLELENSATVLSELLGVEPELAAVKQLIAEKTEGNPFFVEEMVHGLFEQGVLVRKAGVKLIQPLADIKAPATVQAVLTSRIDRLPVIEKELLQTLAVMGRDFSLPLLFLVTGRPDGELKPMLAHLIASEFIYKRSAFADSEFIFKHALTQEVAYNSLLVERRKLMHGHIGAAIERLHADRLDDHLGELAHHFGRTDNYAKGVEYHGKAGMQEQHRGAYATSITYFGRALELLNKIEPSGARDREELTLRLGLGASLMAVRSIGAPELTENYARASELCRDQADIMQVLPALFGQCWHYLGKGELGAACELGREMVTLAATTPSPLAWLWADSALGAGQVWSGEFCSARTRLEHGLALYEEKRAGRAVTDFGVLCLSYLAIALWHLGFAEQARSRMRESLALAERLKDVHSTGHSLGAKTIAQWLRRDLQQLQHCAEKAIAFAAEHELSYWLPIGRLMKGCALSKAGEHKEAIQEINHALSAYRATGSKMLLPMLLGALVEAYTNAGRTEEALDTLKDAFAAIEAGRFYASELHRQQGELLLMQNPSNTRDAERSFRSAIEIAQHQNAKSWELRAASSLARLLMNQGYRAQACAMLTEIYSWFTEGFDTADLKEARRCSMG